MINIIAAHSENRVIGNNGKIPWDLPDDRQRFKNLTMGNVVVMGRRTYEEIGHPLPGRINAVISSNGNYDGCINVRSLREVIERFPEKDIFIAGGEKLYKEALPVADTIYITEILSYAQGDRFFPLFDKSLFTITESEYVGGELPHRYVTYKKKIITEKR